jgi:hypothetical protein
VNFVLKRARERERGARKRPNRQPGKATLRVFSELEVDSQVVLFLFLVLVLFLNRFIREEEKEQEDGDVRRRLLHCLNACFSSLTSGINSR